MSLRPAKNFLITFDSESIRSLFSDLMIKNIHFEILDPTELGDEWEGQVSPAYKSSSMEFNVHDGEMNLLSAIIEKHKPKGFLSSLIDDRYKGTVQQIQDAKANKDKIMHIARVINKYEHNIHKLEEAHEVERKAKDNVIHLCGYNLSSFVGGLQRYVDTIVEKFNENHPNQTIDISVPEFKLIKKSDFDVVEFSREDEGIVTMYMKDEYSSIKTLQEFKSWLIEANEDIIKEGKKIGVDPENVTEDQLRLLSALHAGFEIDKTIADISGLVFQTEENGAKFVFISVAQDQLSEFEEIAALHCFSAQEITWNREILMWTSKGSLNGFKSIAQSVGTIDSKEADPTWVITIFFSIFFAFCLADALYGLFLAVFCGYFLFFKELKPGLVNIFRLFAVSGLATVAFGVITNSYLGDLSAYLGFEGALENLQLINILDPEANVPVNNFLRENGGISPIVVLLGSAVLIGLINLLTAYVMKIITGVRSGEMATVREDSAWLAFVLGIFVMVTGLIIPSFFIIAAVIFGLTVLSLFVFSAKEGVIGKIMGGLGSMYGLISLGADILSYTRLVAVGLTGGIIANVINLLADLVFNSFSITVLGVIAAIGVLIVGHVFNLVISLFGAYINPLRLHYVEFLPKFYEGRGREFRPSSSELKYFRTDQPLLQG